MGSPLGRGGGCHRGMTKTGIRQRALFRSQQDQKGWSKGQPILWEREKGCSEDKKCSHILSRATCTSRQCFPVVNPSHLVQRGALCQQSSCPLVQPWGERVLHTLMSIPGAVLHPEAGGQHRAAQGVPSSEGSASCSSLSRDTPLPAAKRGTAGESECSAAWPALHGIPGSLGM